MRWQTMPGTVRPMFRSVLVAVVSLAGLRERLADASRAVIV